MHTYSIYALRDPLSREVRYVGATCKGVQDRFKRHLSTSPNFAMRCWVKSLIETGRTPKVQILEVIEQPYAFLNTRVPAGQREQHFIRLFQAAGHRLFNCQKSTPQEASNA